MKVLKRITLFIILLILTIYFRESGVSLIIGTICGLYTIFLFTDLLTINSSDQETQKENSVGKTSRSDYNTPSSLTDEYSIERFAIMCNAQLLKDEREVVGDVSEINSNDISDEPMNESSKLLYEPCTDIDSMTGIEFENFCSDLLKKNEFEKVEITKVSCDHGVDILAEKEGITYAIQCKCYSSNIGNAAVQQVHAGKTLYQKDVAVVLTNRYFTSQAISEAYALGVKLWDRDKLNEMIGKAEQI